MNWLIVLLQSATSRGSGIHPDTWQQVSERSDLPVPDDVRALYEQTDGATFSGEVTLWPWKQVEQRTSRGLGSLKASDAWLLGSKRGTGTFFVARPRPLMRALPAAARTNWLRAVDADTLVYGLWRAADDVLVVKTLRELLAMHIGRPGEDFGEVTYVRALKAVKNALAELEPSKTKPARPSRPSGSHPAPKPPPKKKR